ncbi:MAG: AAA family ATPase [Candidatus Hadarchaeales archaeon]
MTLFEDKIGKDQVFEDYLMRWGLKEDPFKLELSSIDMFVPVQEDDLKKLKWVLTGGKLGVITGGLGTGKTTLCSFLVTALREESLLSQEPSKNVIAVFIHGAAYKSMDEILRAIMLGLEMDPNRDRASMFEILRRWPKEHAERLAIVVDDIHESRINPRDIGEFLRVLVDIPNITVLINGEPRKMARFLEEVPALRDRVQVRVEINPLNREKMRAILDLRIKNAGCENGSVLLTEKGFETIYRLSGGIPRKALKIASMALRYAAEKGGSIDENAVKKGNRISFFRRKPDI